MSLSPSCRANSQNVDFLVHGGDLFHEHKPSKETLIRTEQLLAQHVFGEKTHSFKVAAGRCPVNIKDPNLSIRLPIFVIHGNHDDPGGMENLSNIDILNATKLVNYFGRSDSVEQIEVSPLLFQKGMTKIALYGIGYMKDSSFNLAFEKKRVKFLRPEGSEWFNILVLHQTKERGGTVGYNRRCFVRERTLPDFINLVLWGHEHECIPSLKECPETGSQILYMGSTTITSLIDSEARPKHCFIVTIEGRKMDVLPVPLRRARPFLYGQIELSKCKVPKDDEKAIEVCIVKRIDEMLKTSHHEAGQLPLLRLKVEYSGYQVVNTRKMTTALEGKIANHAKDFIKFYKSPFSSAAAGNRKKDAGKAQAAEGWKEVEDPDKLVLDQLVCIFAFQNAQIDRTEVDGELRGRATGGETVHGRDERGHERQCDGVDQRGLGHSLR